MSTGNKVGSKELLDDIDGFTDTEGEIVGNDDGLNEGMFTGNKVG